MSVTLYVIHRNVLQHKTLASKFLMRLEVERRMGKIYIPHFISDNRHEIFNITYYRVKQNHQLVSIERREKTTRCRFTEMFYNTGIEVRS